MGYDQYKPTKNICDYHKDIETYSLEILKIKSSTYEEAEDLLYAVQSLADDIYTAVQYAYVAGNNMEDRLYVYKNGIESLGFKRDRE